MTINFELLKVSKMTINVFELMKVRKMTIFLTCAKSVNNQKQQSEKKITTIQNQFLTLTLMQCQILTLTLTLIQCL